MDYSLGPSLEFLGQPDFPFLYKQLLFSAGNVSVSKEDRLIQTDQESLSCYQRLCQRQGAENTAGYQDHVKIPTKQNG